MASELDREIFARDADLTGARAKTINGSFALVVSQILRLMLQFGTQLLLARILFPGDFGLLAMVAPIVGFVNIINDVGFSQILIQRRSIFQQQVSNLFWISLALGCSFGAVLIISSPFISYIYKEPQVMALMALMALLVPLGTLGLHPNALLSRQLRFSALARIDVASTIAGGATTLACAFGGFGYWSLAIGQLVSTCISVAASWSACQWCPSMPLFSLSVRAEFDFGKNVTGANITGFAVTNFDSLLVGVVEGPVQLGLYDRSYRLLVQPLSQLMLPLTKVAVPLLSSVTADPVKFSRTYLFMVQLIAVAVTPGVSVCIADGATVIRVLLGSRWEAAGPIFSWICVGGLASGLYSSAGWLFIAQDRTAEMLKYWTISAILCCISFGIGINWGAVGVAGFAAVCFVTLQTPLVMYGALKTGSIAFRDLLGVLVHPAASAIMIILLLRFGPEVKLEAGWLTLFIRFIFGYGVLFIALLASRSGRTFLLRLNRTIREAKLVQR